MPAGRTRRIDPARQGLASLLPHPRPSRSLCRMQYRKLGRWGVQVSAVGLGSWLTYGGSVEADAARECIWRAYDLGVTFFDTANVYMRGRAEEVMGKALADFRRDSYVLATKVYFDMGDGPNDGGLSRKH